MNYNKIVLSFFMTAVCLGTVMPLLASDAVIKNKSESILLVDNGWGYDGYTPEEEKPSEENTVSVAGAVVFSMLPFATGSWFTGGGWGWLGTGFMLIKTGSFITFVTGIALDASSYEEYDYYSYSYEDNNYSAIWLAGMGVWIAFTVIDMIYSGVVAYNHNRKINNRPRYNKPRYTDSLYGYDPASNRFTLTVVPRFGRKPDRSGAKKIINPDGANLVMVYRI